MAYQPGPASFPQHGQAQHSGHDEIPPPPLSSMHRVQGYENVKFKADAFIAPPAAYQSAALGPSHATPVQANIPTMSTGAAKDALMREVSSHCCYGKKAAQEVTVTNVTPSSAFHYQLETYAEGRQTAWAFEPYSGQPVDTPQNGRAPGPWEIPAHPPEMFKENTKVFEVPHTATVQVCHGCSGAGNIQCKKCQGKGKLTCTACNGTKRQVRQRENGQNESVTCTSCSGAGNKNCQTCNGKGRVDCSVCKAKKHLKCYIKLTVSWKNHKDDNIVERTALPDHLIRGAQGKVAFQDTQPRVYPVTGFPDDAVNNASKQLVQKHSVSFPTERILSQRHWIRIVPVFEAHTNSFNFWVYGEDNKVYAPEYPQKCCWGCTIL